MILKLREVYRERSLNKGRTGPTWSTREVFVNTKHIVMIRPNIDMSRRLQEGLIPDLEKGTDFCTLSLDRGQSGTDVIVVGSLSELESTVFTAGRELLNG